MTLTSNSNVNFGYQETTLTKFNNMVQQRTCQKSSTLNCSDSRIHQRLGQLVNALTEDLGSERKLGRITDISHVGLRKWSLCKADPKLQNLIQFAYSLGWSLTELISLIEGNEDIAEMLAKRKRQKALAPDSEEVDER